MNRGAGSLQNLGSLPLLTLIPEADPLLRGFHIQSSQGSAELPCNCFRRYFLTDHLLQLFDVLRRPQFSGLATLLL